MKERPIIMSGDNPKLILEGRKTQTRRIIKPQPQPELNIFGGPLRWKHFSWFEGGSMPDLASACPYGITGDRLWVREKWADRGDRKILFAADFRTDKTTRREMAEYITWRPSIHMPRWASQITLEILNVRVQRVQDISEENAKAEGMQFHDGAGIGHSGWRHSVNHGIVYETANRAYQIFWDSLHGKGAWERNDWVWVIGFKVVNHP